MPATTNFGFIYPDEDDHTMLWEHFQVLAEGVDVAMALKPAREAVGAVNITLNNSPGGTANISFPAGRFTSPPHIQLTKAGAGAAKAVPYYTSNSVNGATIGLYSGDGTNYSASVVLAWRAYQPMP